MRFIIWERSVQKKTDFWIVLCCILKEPKINMLEFSCWCKKIPNLSMKNYTQFHSFSLIKRVKYEMISPFSRNEKWKIFSLHSFREVKVKIKWLKIEIEKWKWKSNDSKSRSRSEFSKKFSRILENRDSRWSLIHVCHLVILEMSWCDWKTQFKTLDLGSLAWKVDNRVGGEFCPEFDIMEAN